MVKNKMDEFDNIEDIVTCATKKFKRIVSNALREDIFIYPIKNTKNAPKNGVVNKERVSPPFSYLGIKFILTFVTDIEHPELVLKEHNIYVSVGGPIGENSDGTKVFNFMMELFLDDFPLIKKKYGEIMIMKLINNQPPHVTVREINSW